MYLPNFLKNNSRTSTDLNQRFHLFRIPELSPASLVLIMLLLIGFGLRIWRFLQIPSLNFDEVLLVLNIRDRAFLDLLKPLDTNQVAPFGFLLSQKAIMTLFGNRDFIFRLLPLAFGLASLVLMLPVSKLYNQGKNAWIAIGLFAITSPLLYYSYIVKQYMGDVFFALLLLYLAQKCLRTDKTPSDFFVLFITSVIAIWFSQAIVFVLFGIFLALTLDNLLSKNWRYFIWAAFTALIAVLNFLLYYYLSLRHSAGNQALTDFWEASFMPMPIWKNWNWFPQAFQSALDFPVGLQASLLVSLLFWIGIISIIVRNWRYALILLAPIVATLAASGLHKYPFGNRLILFLVPIFFLILGEGTDRVIRLTGRPHRVFAIAVWIVIVISLFFYPLKVVVTDLRQPYAVVGIKSSLAYLSQNYQGEMIYIYYGAIPAFRYYASFYGLEDSNHRFGITSRKKPRLYREDMDQLPQNQRVWFLFTHSCSWCKVNEEQYFLTYLEQTGIRLDEAIFPGSSVYLYALGKQ